MPHAKKRRIKRLTIKYVTPSKTYDVLFVQSLHFHLFSVLCSRSGALKQGPISQRFVSLRLKECSYFPTGGLQTSVK